MGASCPVWNHFENRLTHTLIPASVYLRQTEPFNALQKSEGILPVFFSLRRRVYKGPGFFR